MTKHKWKPQLLPNDPTGSLIDWRARVGNPSDWLVSRKLDGARIELTQDGAFSRALKYIQNTQIQRMATRSIEELEFKGVIEGEFYAPNMTFSEIMHFFKTEDVTSESSVEKYRKLWEKTKGDPAKGWKYPGRSVEWLTTWRPELKFYLFDHVMEEDNRTKATRVRELMALSHGKVHHGIIIPQHIPRSMEDIMDAYTQCVQSGGEGLVLMKAKSLYKPGRLTLRESQGFKMKNNDVDYTGTVIDVLEGTVAREGAEKTINELGRSRTSQLKEDRIPSGMSKGFLVRMDNGKELTVSLKDYSHADRVHILHNKNTIVGQTIKFTGMPPVKPGGVPRSAHYVKGNLRS